MTKHTNRIHLEIFHTFTYFENIKTNMQLSLSYCISACNWYRHLILLDSLKLFNEIIYYTNNEMKKTQ